ncbi:MAG: pyridoxal phosphate-dependent aminotransferase [Bacteroidota bacterium]
MAQLLAEHITILPDSATLAMSKKVAELERKGLDIINLSIGEPDFKTPQYIQQAAQEAIETGEYFGYAPVAGYADLREAIAEKLCVENKISCAPEQIVVSNGAKQSIFNTLVSLVDRGDEVIIYTPYWVSYDAMVRLVGGTPVYVQGSATHHFEPTPEQLDSAITSRTKAIVFSSPCNPTGHILSLKSLEGIATVLNKHAHVIVIADEIYEYINFTGMHASLGALNGMQDRVVTVNGFSKGFAMTGWRIGYLTAPLWLANACEKVQGQATSSPCSIAQRAALAAIQGDRKDVKAMAAVYRKRRDLALSLLRKVPDLRVSAPSGAFYLFPDVSRYLNRTDGQVVIRDSEALCMYLLQQAHVSVVNGEAFGMPGHIRLSYAVSEALLKTATERIAATLDRLY